MKPSRNALLLASFMVGLALFPSGLEAKGPSATTDPKAFTKKQIEAFTQIVDSKQKHRLETLRLEVRKIFDFSGFAKNTLGRRYKELKSKEQRRFNQAVRALLENTYLKHPDKIFREHAIQITSSNKEGKHAQVTGVVKQEDVDMEVVLKMTPRKKTWVVHDLVLDELSLLEDYQYQFKSYLKNKSPKQLVERLEQKVAEQRQAASPNKKNGTTTPSPNPTH